MSISPATQPMTESGDGVWWEPFHARSYDVDFRRQSTVAAICRAFLEAAWNHAEHLGFGYSALATQNKLWVLSRLLVQIDHFPCWGQHARLCTWPHGESGVLALRDFELFNEGGKRLAAGSSSWLVLDSATHRPQRLDKLPWRVPIGKKRAAIREANKLLECTAEASVSATEVRYSDIDVNQHVNSVRYIEWLLDSYPLAFHQTHQLKSIELNYTGETRWSDIISLCSQKRSPLEISHSIIKHDKVEVCRAEIIWSQDFEPPAPILGTPQ